MKKRYLLFLLPLLLFPIFSQKTSADVGEAPSSGGALEPGDKTNDIVMINETVLFDIDDDCPFDGYEEFGCWFAHVTATFKMNNFSDSDVDMNLTYPYPSWQYEVNEWFDPDNDQTINIVVEVNGSVVEYDYSAYSYEADYYNLGELNEYSTMSVDFPVKFPAGEDVDIVVEYDTRLVHEPKSTYGTFLYLMSTGSHWYEQIGNGVVEFKFPNKINRESFLFVNDFFEFKEDSLEWIFFDLEPTEKHNIRVTFSPNLLEIWGESESIETVKTKEKSQSLFVYSDDLTTPPVFEVHFGVPYESSQVYLLQEDVPTEEEGHNGWFVKKDPNKTPTLDFELDAVYEVSGLNVFSGIGLYVYNKQTEEYQTLWDMFDRAKEIKLTFSDGSNQTINLEDTPDELQEVSFDTVETSSIKVEVLDSFKESLLKEPHLGIARLSFDIGDKVREKDQPVEEEEEEKKDVTTDDDQSFIEKYAVVIIAIVVVGFVLVVGILIVGFIIVRRKRKTKSPTPPASDVSNEPSGEDVLKQVQRE
jgi:hypothetical protein